MSEQDYERGHRAALLGILSECLRQLGYEDPETMKAAWIKEREQAIATLRSACERHGDNEWPEDLNLSDVIDKHLLRYIEGEQERG